MFHLAEETALFQCSGRLFLFSTFTRACFGFGAKNWEALTMLGPCKPLRSDNSVSVDGRDIFCFKILIRLGVYY